MEACWVGMCNERRRRKRQNDNQIDSDDENFVKKSKTAKRYNGSRN